MTPHEAFNVLAHISEPSPTRLAALDVLQALIKRDDDVRTLDDWARGVRSLEWQCCDCGLPKDDENACCTLMFADDSELEFYGSTTDEARAKAAAWVRKQVKP